MCRRFGTYGIKSHLSTRTDVNQVLSFGCYSAIIVAVKEGGLGRSITTLTPDNIVTVFKVTASLSTCFSALTSYPGARSSERSMVYNCCNRTNGNPVAISSHFQGCQMAPAYVLCRHGGRHLMVGEHVRHVRSFLAQKLLNHLSYSEQFADYLHST